MKLKFKCICTESCATSKSAIFLCISYIGYWHLPVTTLSVEQTLIRRIFHTRSVHLFSLLCQGKHLQRGSRDVDVHISIGDSVCVPVSLSDNQVECRPPIDKPDKDVNDTFCYDDTLPLQVCLKSVN